MGKDQKFKEKVEREFIESLQKAVINRVKREATYQKFEKDPNKIVLEDSNLQCGTNRSGASCAQAGDV